MGVLPTFMSTYHVCAWCPEEGFRSPGTGVINYCDLPRAGKGT